MASFDVTSLFTNIPLDETIEIIAQQLFHNSEIFHVFSRAEFIKLLNLAVKIVTLYLIENFTIRFMV